MNPPGIEHSNFMTPVRNHWRQQASCDPPMADRLLALLNREELNDMARCQYAAVFLIHFWQLAARNSPGPVPSFFLIRPTGNEDGIFEEVLSLPCIPTESDDHNRSSTPNARSAALSAMEGVIAIRIAEKRGKTFHWPAAARMKQWNDSCLVAFGSAPRGPYAKRFHEKFRVITPPDDHKTAVVRTRDDIRAMRADLAEMHDLTHPVGYDGTGDVVTKVSPIAGALALHECPRTLVEWALVQQKRVLFLPHAGVAAMPFPYEKEIRDACASIHMELRSLTFPHKMGRNEDLPHIPGEVGYLEFMRSRLIHVPLGYQTHVLDTVCQLKTVAIRVGDWITQPGVPPEPVVRFIYGYYLSALRGIAMGIAWLAWHGEGIVPKLHRGQMQLLLRAVRQKGEITRRELHRPLQRHMDANMRDQLLHLMEYCGVVRLIGKKVIAVSYEEFLAGITELPGFPRPKAKVPAP